MLIRIAFVATIALMGIPAAWAQEEGADPSNRDERGGRRGRFNREEGERGRRGEGREQRREGNDGEERRRGFERFRNATQEERQRMMVDRMVDMTARNYELNETEKEVVRKEMQTMAVERRAAMGAEAAELDRLREEMFKFWSQPPANENEGRERFERMRNDPQFQEIRRRMREIEDKYPFNWEESVKRVENLIPPEKVAKGHARVEEFRRGFEDRRRNFERGGENRREESNREGRRDRGNRRRGDRERRGENRSDPGAGAQPATGAQPPVAVAPAEVHPWEKYVQKFLADHDATANQASAAHAILKDVRTRAERVEAGNRDALVQAEKITDAAAKKKRLDELNKPINDLFEELKRRCDGLLTAEQRTKKAGKRL